MEAAMSILSQLNLNLTLTEMMIRRELVRYQVALGQLVTGSTRSGL
jgi:hypothetical protein